VDISFSRCQSKFRRLTIELTRRRESKHPSGTPDASGLRNTLPPLAFNVVRRLLRMNKLLCVNLWSESLLKPLQSVCVAAIEKLAHLL